MKVYQTRIILLLFGAMLLGGCVSATTAGSKDDSDIKPLVHWGVPIKTVYYATLEAMGALGWTVESEESGTYSIEARTPMSLSTWGDSLTVVITDQDNDLVRVDVTSKTGGQLFDWGKNKQNIIDLYLEIDKALLSQ